MGVTLGKRPPPRAAPPEPAAPAPKRQCAAQPARDDSADRSASIGLKGWAAKAQATCTTWGLAKATSSAHATVQRQFWAYIGSVARCSFAEFVQNPTDNVCAFAQWCADRAKSSAYGPLKAASVEQYVGSLLSSMRIRHKPIAVDRVQLNFFMGALRRRETNLVGPPAVRKMPLTADLLDVLCAEPAYRDIVLHVNKNAPMPVMSASAANQAVATAAACFAFATANRASSVAVGAAADFNPLVHATRSDLEVASFSVRYLHKPTKNDKDGHIWRGMSPVIPRVSSRACCPVLAIKVRDALFPQAMGKDSPLFPCFSARGLISPLSCKQYKKWGIDRLLRLCPPGITSLSARSGHATAAFEAGASPAMIQQFGKWKSDTWRVYTRVTDKAASAHVLSLYA